jgi:hypothetical protein
LACFVFAPGKEVWFETEKKHFPKHGAGGFACRLHSSILSGNVRFPGLPFVVGFRPVVGLVRFQGERGPEILDAQARFRDGEVGEQ